MKKHLIVMLAFASCLAGPAAGEPTYMLGTEDHTIVVHDQKDTFKWDDKAQKYSQVDNSMDFDTIATANINGHKKSATRKQPSSPNVAGRDYPGHYYISLAPVADRPNYVAVEVDALASNSAVKYTLAAEITEGSWEGYIKGEKIKLSVTPESKKHMAEEDSKIWFEMLKASIMPKYAQQRLRADFTPEPVSIEGYESVIAADRETLIFTNTGQKLSYHAEISPAR